MFIVNRSNFILNKWLYFCFLFFVFFPYIQIVPLGTDTQPYALMFGFLLFFLFDKKFTWVEQLLAFLVFSSFIIFLVSDMTFNSIRSFIGYASLFFIAYITFRVLRTGRIDLGSFITYSVITWFFIALIQMIFSRNFITFIVSGARTTDNRGVTGLAPEPTFLGITFLFFMIIIFLVDMKNKKLLVSLCVIGIVFLAQSSMVVLFLAILIGLWAITHINIKSFFGIVLIVILAPMLFMRMSDTRLGYLFNRLIEEPESLVLVDASINDRFFHIFFSIKGFFENFLMPNGFDFWVPYVSSQVLAYSNYVIVEWFSFGGRIMSGFGAGFYELGIIFMIVPYVLFWLLYKIFSANLRLFIFHFSFIFIIMFSAITISYPLFGFYIGLLQYLLWKKHNA